MSALFSKTRGTVCPRRPARRRSLSPSVDGLDQRCLLSKGMGHAMGPHAAEVIHQGHATAAHAATVRQNDIETMGLVIKAPQNRVFYEDYVGPKLAELNAVGAIGEPLPNGSFTFIGINQGVINPKVRATYVFGIDRNGKLATGPFPGRPNIRFDATVAIEVEPGQLETVTVTDLANKKSETFQLPAPSGNNPSIGVTIPGSLLPSTGLAPSQYRYAYWPQVGQAGSTHIASFAPGFPEIQVGVPE